MQTDIFIIANDHVHSLNIFSAVFGFRYSDQLKVSPLSFGRIHSISLKFRLLISISLVFLRLSVVLCYFSTVCPSLV